MKLSPNDRKNLLTIILESYPDIAEIAMLINLELGENLDNIIGGSNNKQKVFNLIKWAENSGKLIDLLQAISKDRPDNVELQENLKSLTNKYSEDNKINSEDHQDNQKTQNKKKLFLFINLFLGILIIPIGIVSYRILYQPLYCDDTQLQQQNDSIKIIIADFEGSYDPNLKNYLKKILKEQIPPDVTICQFNQKVKESYEANEIGKKFFPKNPNSVLVIWGRISKYGFSGEIESIDDNSDDISLDIPLDEKDQSKFQDTSLINLDLKINYVIASLYYVQENKDRIWDSQKFLETKLDKIINCQLNQENQIVINNYDKLIDVNLQSTKQITAESYSLLGDFYKKNKNVDGAIQSYKCSYQFEENSNRRNTLLLQQAEIYVGINKINQAEKIYQDVINNGSNDSKSRALVSRANMFVNLKQCHKAERDLGQVIDENLDRPWGLDVRSDIRLFDCEDRRGAIADLFEFSKIDPESFQSRIDNYSKMLRKRTDYQKIVSELQEIQRTHPEWKQLINQLIQPEISQ